MLSDLLRFEWRYHTRQVSFAAAVLLFFGAGFALAGSGFGPQNIHLDSPYAIAESTGLVSLLSVFVLAVFCASAVVRDRDHRMEEIVFTTSVEKLQFLLGRFSGAFLAAFTAFSATAPGLLAGRLMPWHDADRLGPIDPLAYLHALLVFGLPNVLFAAVVLFAVAAITRNALATYAASVFLYVLYFIAAALTNSPLMAASAPGAEGSMLAALLDPFGLTAFFEQTRYWTAAERNTRLVALSGALLVNRVVWVAVAGAGLAAVYRFFSFRLIKSGAEAAPASEGSGGRSGRRSTPFLSAARIELRAILGNLSFLALLVLWIALAVSEIVTTVRGGELGSAFQPTTALIHDAVAQPLSLIGMMLLIYCGAELVWRERTLRFAEILHATPASNAVFLLAKWVALCALAGVLTVTAFLAGAVVERTFEPGLLLAFIGLNLAPLVLFAAVALLIQTLTPHKYLGMILVLAFGVVAQRGEIIGLEHPLLRFADAPAIEWSAFGGFGAVIGPWSWRMAYWGAFAGLALVIAIARWRRDRPRFHKLAAALFAVVFAGTGAFVFADTDFESSDDVLAWRAAYERRYVAMAALPRPRIREVTASIDLEPERLRYRVRGEYLLVNETTAPIATMLVAVRRDAGTANLVAPPNATLTHDARFGQWLVRYQPPLAVGSSTRLRFDVTYDKPDDSIAGNGSYIMSFRSLPTIGYRTSYEIRDPGERRRRGLTREPGRAEESGEIASGDWTRFDVKVSTAPDQIVVAPGALVEDALRDGRRVFHFRSEEPIPNQFAIASARYRVVKETHDGVVIEVYHHPGHEENVVRVMRAAAESLRLFSKSFGPYRHAHLRIAEVPRYWSFGGFAQPGVIFLHEQRAFGLDVRESTQFDLLYRRTAHEIAHQWWGHTLVAADAPGGTMLTESLAKYAELLALQKAYGGGPVRRSLEYEHDLYLSQRTDESGAEPPLARSADQSYLYYRKGAIVLWALRDLLGEETLNGALRALLEAEGGPDRRPTTAHLIAQLNAVASPAQRTLIDEWLNQVVLHDLRLTSATSRPLADGRYEVTLRIEAGKGDVIAIGLYAEDRETLVRARLVPGTNQVTFVVDQQPDEAMIDPYITRIDRNRTDNKSGVRWQGHRSEQPRR